jgi:hypothetical protein
MDFNATAFLHLSTLVRFCLFEENSEEILMGGA